jgi:hypothetical protein
MSKASCRSILKPDRHDWPQSSKGPSKEAVGGLARHWQVLATECGRRPIKSSGNSKRCSLQASSQCLMAPAQRSSLTGRSGRSCDTTKQRRSAAMIALWVWRPCSCPSLARPSLQGVLILYDCWQRTLSPSPRVAAPCQVNAGRALPDYRQSATSPVMPRNLGCRFEDARCSRRLFIVLYRSDSPTRSLFLQQRPPQSSSLQPPSGRYYFLSCTRFPPTVLLECQ